MLTRSLVFIGLLLCGACDSGPLASQDASFTARIAESIASGNLRVDSLTWIGTGNFDASAVLLLAKSTPVFAEEADGSYADADQGQLQAGRKVLVWTNSVEIRTLPPQYYVRQILLLR